MRIPGLSFSLKRAIGISAIKQKIANKIDIPTTKRGRTQKMGVATSNLISGRGGRVKAATTIVKLTLVDSLLG